MGTMRRIRRRVFGALTVAALGFGGAQAFAAPASAGAGERVCSDQVCDRVCEALGSIGGGFCSPAGICVCYRG